VSHAVILALSVERILNVVLMVRVFHRAGASVVVVFHVPPLAIPNVVTIRVVVQQMTHVVMTENVPGQVTYAVAKLPVDRIRYVVLMVRVPHLVNVVGMATVNQMKGVAMMSVFHKISVVMTHTAASVRNVVLIKRVPHLVNVAGFYTVYQTRPAAGTLIAVDQTGSVARVSAVPQTGPVARTMVSAVPQARPAARRAIAVPQARPAAIALRAPNLVSVAVMVLISAEGVRYVVLMVRVGAAYRVHVVESKTAVGRHVVIIVVVDLVRDVVLMVRVALVA
jgi:hypothetical protein